MKKLKICLLIGLAICLAVGCKKKEEPKVEKKEPVKKEEVVVPEVEENKIPEGMGKSYLTGEWIDEALVNQRPVSIMFGNSSEAMAQSGIGSADIIYEAPVEGGYTRLMAIIQDYANLEKIGCIRSCRHYFIPFALEFDSMYLHHGQAPYALDLLGQDFVHNISAMDGSIESLAFYRTSDRKAPHNSYTSGEGINKAIEKKGYRKEYEASYEGHYQFAEDDTPVELTAGVDALFVNPGYFVGKGWFEYDKEKGIYNRFIYEKPQIDAETQEQITVKNIILQTCKWKNMDENGYLDFNTTDGGSGKYITNGKAIDITWSKDSQYGVTHYYDTSGKEITLNQGKTFVCIIQDSNFEKVQILDSIEKKAE